MGNVEIVTAPDSLQMGTSGSIVGTLSLRIGDLWFPDRSWTDFVVVVLGWWAREIACLQARDPGRFVFMDGDFQFVARPLPDGVRCVVNLGRDAPNREAALGSCEVHTQDLISAVEKAARFVLDACSRRQWENAAIEELRVWASRGAIEQGAGRVEDRRGTP